MSHGHARVVVKRVTHYHTCTPSGFLGCVPLTGMDAYIGLSLNLHGSGRWRDNVNVD